jgi:hypothetical protein
MTEHIELPADLKTQIQDEVKFQQCRFDEQTHQGIDAAIRVFARLVESWRLVPAEAGTVVRYSGEYAAYLDAEGSVYQRIGTTGEIADGTVCHPAEAGDNEGCGGPGCVSFGGCAVCGPEAAMEEALAAEAGDSTADGRKVVKNLVTCPGDRVRVTYENGNIKVSTVQDDGSYVGDEAVYGGRAEVSYVSPFEDDETATGVYAVRRTTGIPVLIPGPDGWPTWEAGDMRGSSPVEQFWAVEPGERVDSTAGPRAWRDDIGCYWDEEPGGRVRLRVPPHYTAELVLPLAEATESYDLAELRPASSVRNTAEGGAR